MAKSSETIEAEATIIETDVAALSASEEWLAQINERAEKFAEQFKPHDIVGDQDYKDSKKARADANAEIKAIDQERKNMTAAIKRAVRDFETGAKLAIGPLTKIVEQYDEKNHAYEKRWKADREAELAQEYEDMAPFLVPLVPFSKIMGKYGNQKGKGWLNRTTSVETAKDMLAEAVEQIAQAEKTIDSMVEEAYREGAKASFFRTLDLQATLNEEAEARAQRERVARLEAERAERIAAEEAARRQAEEDAWLRQMAEEPVPDDVVRVVAPPSDAHVAAAIDMGEETPGNTEQVYRDEPIPPAPMPAPTPMAPAPMPEPVEVDHPWVVFIPSANRTHILALRDWLNAHGLTGGKVYSGNVYDAYMKELSNANGQ